MEAVDEDDAPLSKLARQEDPTEDVARSVAANLEETSDAKKTAKADVPKRHSSRPNINEKMLASFFQFLQCQLRMEARVCLETDVELKGSALDAMWSKYEPFVRPSLGGREKWMPYHTVLGQHELFLVREVHRADVTIWDERRRFLVMFIFRAHCKGDLFKEVQLPVIREERFWKDPCAYFTAEGELTKAMLAYRRQTRKPMQTQAFRCIPARLVEDDDENLVINIALRTQKLLEVGERAWPIVCDQNKSAEEKFREISAAVRMAKGLGETWAKMLMVSIDIMKPELGLLADHCDVGVGASGGLKLIIPNGPHDPKEALRLLVKEANSSRLSDVNRFWRVLPEVERKACTKFSDLPLVRKQMPTLEKRLSAVTLQVQLCEWRQFKQHRANVRLKDPVREVRGLPKKKKKKKRKQQRKKQQHHQRKQQQQQAPQLAASTVDSAAAAIPAGLRIGCIGDSCTYGTGLSADDKYPAQLQLLLDARTVAALAAEDGEVLPPITVENFGKSGATAGEGEKAYDGTKAYERAVEFTAQIYVVMLGTNDAWHADPTKAEEGLTSHVAKLRAAVPGCSIVLVLPPGGKNGKCRGYLDAMVHPAVRSVAAAEGLPLVEPLLRLDTAYLPDMVHLSRDGARAVAEAVAAVLPPILTEAAARTLDTDARMGSENAVRVLVRTEVDDDTFDDWHGHVVPRTTLGQLGVLWRKDRPGTLPIAFCRMITDAAGWGSPDGDVLARTRTLADLGAEADFRLLVCHAEPPRGAGKLAAVAASAVSPGESIRFVALNGKRPGSDSWARYEKYKVAKTVAEALALGAKKGDIDFDLKKGFCKRGA